MKHITLLTITAYLIISSSSAQCVKNISTNPDAPINDEFLGLMNQWYPDNGPYTNNSFLNGFDWRWPKAIDVDLSQSWSHPLSNFNSVYHMVNPFDDAMGGDFAYLQQPSDPKHRDYQWEDGWELLWMNLGYYPNGDLLENPSDNTYFANNSIQASPLPANIPYFILYNRYRGMMRIFANVWFDNLNQSFQDITLTLRYLGNSKISENLSGVLRHASGLDQTLDQPTRIREITSPRFHPPNTSTWFVAEFQMAYDPCSCLSRGKFELVFKTIESMDVDILSRSISIPKAITDANYKTEDFLNLSDLEGKDYKPGTRIYREMDDLLLAYQSQLTKYNSDLKDYNAFNNNLTNKFIGAVKDAVTNGLNDALPYGDIAAFLSIMSGEMGLTKPDKEFILPSYIPPIYGPAITFTDGQKIKTSTTITYVKVANEMATLHRYKYADLEKNLIKDGKKVLGQGVDFLSGAIIGKAPTKPVKPSPSVATLTETTYKGTIAVEHETRSASLLVPGTAPSGYSSNGVNINSFNYPAYNETMGVFALLKTPSFYWKEDRQHFHVPSRSERVFENNGQKTIQKLYNIKKEYRSIDFKLKDPLSYRFNPALDIDESKTKIFIQYEIEIDQKKRTGLDFEIIPYSNLYEAHRFDINNEIKQVYLTKWVPLELSGEIYYSLTSKTSLEYLAKENISFRGFPSSSIHPEAPDVQSLIKHVKMKIMVDVYFDQIGSDGEQVNNTQVFTELLYSPISRINAFTDHGAEFTNSQPGRPFLPGVIELEGQIINHNSPLIKEKVGSNLFIRAEEIKVIGKLKVEKGYFLFLEGVNGVNVAPSGSLGENISARQKGHYNFPLQPEASTQDVDYFCNDQENGYLAKTWADTKNNIENSKGFEAPLDFSIKLYPNPSSRLTTVEVRSEIAENYSIQLVDLNGRLILKENIKTETGYLRFEIDISSYSKGMYVLNIRSSKGVLQSKKLIKT